MGQYHGLFMYSMHWIKTRNGCNMDMGGWLDLPFWPLGQGVWVAYGCLLVWRARLCLLDEFYDFGRWKGWTDRLLELWDRMGKSGRGGLHLYLLLLIYIGGSLGILLLGGDRD